MQIEQLRSELLATSARAEQAASAAAQADESTANLVSGLAARVDQLSRQVEAAEARARTAEAAASDAGKIARAALDEAAALRNQMDARDVRSADDREAWDIKFSSLLSQSRRWHEDAQSGLAGSQAAISSLATSVDRVTAEASRINGSLLALGGELTSLRETVRDSDGALARDVALLADALVAAKAAAAAEAASLAARISALSEVAAEATRVEAGERERRLVQLQREMQADVEVTRRSIAGLEVALSASRRELEDHSAMCAADARAAAARAGATERHLESQVADGLARIEELQARSAARMDALSGTVHALTSAVKLGVSMDRLGGALLASSGSGNVTSPLTSPERAAASGGSITITGTITSPRDPVTSGSGGSSRPGSSGRPRSTGTGTGSSGGGGGQQKIIFTGVGTSVPTSPLAATEPSGGGFHSGGGKHEHGLSSSSSSSSSGGRTRSWSGANGGGTTTSSSSTSMVRERLAASARAL